MVNPVKQYTSMLGLLAAMLLPTTSVAVSSMEFGASSSPVAMVIDLTGQVMLGREKRRLKVFDELSEGDQVDVPAKATLSLVYYRNGYKFDIRGRSRFIIKRKTINVLRGVPPIRTRTPYRERHHIRPAGLAQASIGMSAGSGRKALIPVYLETAPVIRWDGQRSGVFVLMDKQHRILARRRISGTRMPLSGLSVHLGRGRLYFWTLSNVSGGKMIGAGSFRIAGKELLELTRRLRPGAGSAVADYVLYASWLQSRGLVAEARKYWQLIVARRRHMKRVRELAE